LIPVCGYKVETGIDQTNSNRLLVTYEQKLAKYRNPLSNFMDIESYKLIILRKKAEKVSKNY